VSLHRHLLSGDAVYLSAPGFVDYTAKGDISILAKRDITTLGRQTVSGAQEWSDNFFCLKQNGDFIMLNVEGTIITVGENGKVVDKLQLPVKGEEKVSVEDNTVSFETLGRFNSMQSYKGTIFLTYVQTDSTSHNNTTFLYRASGKEITKESFKGSVEKLAGILNDQLILFDQDKESILRIPLSEKTKK